MPEPLRKTFEIKVLDRRKDGGRIVINTAGVDRDKDRVMPAGARLDDYLRNPIVMFGHNYRDVWSTVGRTTKLEVSPEGIVADFELRPAANEHDPQHIVRLLWDGEWIRTASIGFMPGKSKPNDVGGTDYEEWGLLEWSLVPIPSNQDALRLAVKSLGDIPEGTRVINIRCRKCARAAEYSATLALERLANGKSLLCDKCLKESAKSPACRQADETEAECRSRKIAEILEENPEMERDQAVAIASDMCAEMCEEAAAPARAWVRVTTVDARGLGHQKVLAIFHQFTVEVPQDAVLLQADPIDGSCEEIPHPQAGKSVQFKRATFVPPIMFGGEFGQDGIYVLEQRNAPDDDLFKPLIESGVLGMVELGSIECQLSESETLAMAKMVRGAMFSGLNLLTLSGARSARHTLLKRKRLATQVFIKRGRVLSARNEEKIVAARDNLDEVLAQLEEQPETNDDNKTKGAIAPHTPPKADRDTEWDGPALIASLPNEEVVLRRVHAWVDDKGDPDVKSSYKIPHHLRDGRVVLRGVNNAMARLANTELPQADRAGVERHLKTHQEQFAEEESASLDADGKRDLAEILLTLIHSLKGDYVNE